MEELIPNDFLPHGYCLIWQPGLMMTHIISDAIITLSYYSIPIALAYFIAERRDLAYKWVLGLFVAFIFACGTTHLMAIITLWEPLYWIDGWLKAGTAAISVVTAILLWPLMPKVLALPSPGQLRKSNEALQLQIGERKRAEAEIRRLNNELEKRVIERTAQYEETNQELEAFAYTVSHDLRAPLRAINGFANIVLKDHYTHLPAEVQRYFNLMRDNAQQMGSLIDDLLAFSRLGRQAIKKSTVNMTELVQFVVDRLGLEQEERVINIKIEDLPPCQADDTLLKQVFVNLLSNAVKFTRDCDVAEIEVGCQEVDGESVYYVKDNGIGFEMEYAHKLFGVFQRLHRAEDYEGTGVGLAIVHRIIQRHGGEIWAESEVDRGTIFYFSL
ncbi:MAG: GHKL domain-containing protein [Anaerolineae bacterium]|nr:GHKL domain-containing protein [Anaerolineae bacterium]MCB9103123.1 GHKL domain-containing protein [Anaerolineales bacterium]